MNENRREKVKQNLLSRDTEYLLDIWQNGDTQEWEDGVFEIIENILLDRLGNVPPQSTATQASGFIDKAEDYLERKEFENALRECESAIQINPNSAIAYNYLGEIYDEMDQLENAISNYQKAIQIDPKNQGAWENMLSVELELADDFEESIAKQHLDQALEFANENEIEQALAKCAEAKPFMPNLAIAYNYLGLILQTANQLESAIDAYLKAIQLNPRFYVARKNLANARVVLEEEQYLWASSLTSDELLEITETKTDSDESMIVDGGNPTPGWVYLDANAFLLRGWAGHRNRPGRSGYDPLDTDFEQAHMQGVIIRRLITLNFRTRNPIYLLMMMLMGAFYALYGTMPFFQKGWEGLIIGIVTSPYLLIGTAMLINVFSSLLSKKPKEDEDNGHSFY